MAKQERSESFKAYLIAILKGIDQCPKNPYERKLSQLEAMVRNAGFDTDKIRIDFGLGPTRTPPAPRIDGVRLRGGSLRPDKTRRRLW